MADTTVNGIRGWLVLPLIYLVIGLIAPVIAFYQDPLLFKNSWALISDAENYAEHADFIYFIIATLTASVVFYAYRLVLIIEFFRFSKRLPKAFNIYLLLQLLVSLLLYQFSTTIAEIPPEKTQGFLANLLSSLIAAMVLVPYFVKSKRVKNTFVN